DATSYVSFLSASCYVLLFFSESNRLQLTKTSGNVQTGSSGPVNLECRPSGSGLMDQGVFWLRQKKDKTSLETILFFSSAGKPAANDLPNSERYKGNKGSSAYELKINPFTESDHGTYYCLIKLSSVLFMSPGIQLYPPTGTQSTSPPVIRAPPPRFHPAPQLCPAPLERAPRPRHPPPWLLATEGNTTKNALYISCDLYIWAPLVKLCAFLLIALLVTCVRRYAVRCWIHRQPRNPLVKRGR
uniref:T-cell surface glycoprotein CD8 alpha chain n=1 Tax=Leptobrachium leishanense TaxID=445787 RepID=A0A8C5M5V7_9ANUR